MDDANNPLLDFSGLPRFDAIRTEHVTPAMDALLARARATVDAVAAPAVKATWPTLVEPMTDALDRLERAWGAVRHLNAVVNTPALREAYNANLPKVTAFYTDIAQDLRLFAKYRALRDGASFTALDAAQQRFIDNELRDFRLGGAELPDAEKARFKALQEALAETYARFEENVLDATNAWAHYVTDAAELAGVPDDVLAEARAAADTEGKAGWKLTLRIPCMLPILQYAENRALRRRMHEAYATRASDLGASSDWDNSQLIDRILALRAEAAGLLGYRDYAQVSLVPKMAEGPQDVLDFLRDLARRARPFAENDFAELAAFARDELNLTDFSPWDLAFATERLKDRRYAFSEQEVRQYFPEDQVLAGLFRVVETIYGVRIAESRAPAWHPSVRFFEIRDAQDALVGQFYFDLHAREGKQDGAWMDDAINRRRVGGAIQHPVAYLTCNLSAPIDGKQATFTHDEVITIFHEFGHGLHQLLTRVEVAGVSGIQGVEWDAVELPSQFMENFCWDFDVLVQMSRFAGDDGRHGETLPRALFDRMLAAKNFQSGMGTLRQVEMGLVDMLLHTGHDPARAPKAVLDEVRREIAVVPRAPYDRFMQAFTHVFAGGYAAGYYSYKWAEVLSADAFSLFEEQGVLSPVAGARFRDEVLARGGSRPALESFVAFRGRAPQIDALLRHNGMIAAH